MRIRKHARFAALSLSHAPIASYPRPTLHTHVCELNRSPWDVMSFVSSSDVSYPDQYRVLIDDSITRNSVGGESVSNVECATSLKEQWEEQAKDEDEDQEVSERRILSFLTDVDKEKKENKMGLKTENSVVCCNKTDGKGWKCKREAKEGHSLCNHHLTQLRSYHYNYSQSGRKSDHPKVLAVSRRRNKGRVPSSSSPSEFYYYSGFGPLWGKKRAGGREPNNGDHGRHDDDDDVIITKRARKPIKARSLKSLL